MKLLLIWSIALLLVALSCRIDHKSEAAPEESMTCVSLTTSGNYYGGGFTRCESRYAICYEDGRGLSCYFR